MVRAARRRAVFLDRDGVINRVFLRRGKPYAPRRLAEFRLLPGVAMAIRGLRRAGFLVIVATNHKCFNYAELAQWAKCVVDTRNGLADVATKPGQVWKA